MSFAINLGKKILPYSLSQREQMLERALSSSFTSMISDAKNRSPLVLRANVQANNDLIQKVALSCLFAQILKVVNFVIKIFSTNYHVIDRLLALNELSGALRKKHMEIMNFSKIQHISVDVLKYQNHQHLPQHIKLGVYGIQKFQYQLYQSELARLKKYVNQRVLGTPEEQAQMFASMPQLLQNQILESAEKRGLSKENIQSDLKQLTKRSDTYKVSILKALSMFYNSKIEECEDVINQAFDRVTNTTLQGKTSKIIDPLANRYIYTASAEDLIRQLRPSRHPISVVMAAVEYAGLIKEGGLAEAVAGLSRGLVQQNAKNKVSLVFPKFGLLPATVLSALKEPEVCKTANGVEYKVYSYQTEGVECKFIEHKAFDLPEGYQSIYGPNEDLQGERFAAFSVLAADYISKRMQPDIVHIHDWHAAGIGLQLKKQAAHVKEQQEVQGKKKQGLQQRCPAIMFTYHNNSRAAQGRVLGGGGYNYGGLSSAYFRWGILSEETDNLFVKMIEAADAVTTVSEKFAEESQDLRGDTQGVSFALRAAARVGKLVGILNGANTHLWNPETNKTLKEWKDIDSGKTIDLTYGPNHEDILARKQLSKQQLQAWLAKHQPHVKIDFSKPIVTFVGRLDSTQKGLDQFEAAIDATLKNGGQFVCMGFGDHPDAVSKEVQDPKAKEILDRLQQKYTEGVLWIRDYREKAGPYAGQFHYKDGTPERPGIDLLVRAASDFIFVPSSFEPCGLVQFEGWLFGALAIGANVGGLAESIITKEKDSQKFNGFLFSREDSSKSDHCSAAIQEALMFWNQQDLASKTQLIQRLMREGRQQGWTTSTKKYSPVDKYLYVYDLAKRRAKTHGLFQAFNTEEMRKKLSVLPNQRINKRAQLEELYMINYAHAKFTGISTRELESLYLQLPEEIRSQFPSPYGVNVNHTKYLEYGAKYTPEHTEFSVYAPHAKSLELVLFDENHQVLGTYSMQRQDQTDNWKLQVPKIPAGQKYQYKIDGQAKIDPYARQMSLFDDEKKTPYSIVVDSQHEWTDNAWMQQRALNKGRPQGRSIYEMHPTTWKKKNGQYMNYRELAHDLVDYLKKGNFTHVELMGLLEHPAEKSWGYQVMGYFAPNSRMGSVDDLKYLINYLHQNNIGVILDWVPPHFADYDYSLKNFDGTHLFEPHPWDPRYMFSYRNLFLKFGAQHFDYSKQAVREFLISSAHFWVKEMHVDGLRVDCLKSMLHSEQRDDAELFLRDLNAVIHKKNEGAITIAEDYSGDATILRKLHFNGLGFDFRWNIGFKEDMLKYFTTPLQSRQSYYDQMKNALMQPHPQQQVTYISHDELKSAQNHLHRLQHSSKEERIANWKAMISCLMTSKGPKLMFSGVEMANELYWDQWIGANSGLMNAYPTLSKEQEEVFALTAAFNRTITKEPALYADESHEVEWIEDPSNTVHAYRAKTKNNGVAVIHNFTSQDVKSFSITLPRLYKQGVSFADKQNELRKNLARIEQKTTFIALRELVEKILQILFRRERVWVRIHLQEGKNKRSLLLKVKQVSEITLLNNKEIFSRSPEEITQLLSMPRETQRLTPVELFNSDKKVFGGQDRDNPMIKIIKDTDAAITYEIQIPALTTAIIKER